MPPPASPTAHSNLTPCQLYKVGPAIARGGMGAIHTAEDVKINRTVAMKVVLDPGADDDARQRFILEARVLGQLEHPNIVPIHELGLNPEGKLFYTMKLIRGVSLYDLLKKIKTGDAAVVKQYPLTELLHIFRKICDGVAFAHSRGIVHRDLKPHNVMVGEFGEVLVMDWGLAKILPGGSVQTNDVPAAPAIDDESSASIVSGTTVEVAPTSASSAREQSANSLPAFETMPLERPTGLPRAIEKIATPAPADENAGANAADVPTLIASGGGSPRTDREVLSTMDGQIMGTPNYMPPEQALGLIKEIDARSDIYSLGAILYEILVLHPPVEGTSARDVLVKVARNEIVAPSSHHHSARPDRSAKKSAAPAAPIHAPKAFTPLPHWPDGRIPPALSAVAMRALAAQREQRYETVRLLSSDVEKYLGGFATSAERAGAWTQFWLFLKRNRAVSLSLVASFILLVGISIAFDLRVMRERNTALQERNRAEDERQMAENERSRARNYRKRAEETLEGLRSTAPSFFAQAKALFDAGKIDDAIEKIGYAISLDSENAEYRLLRDRLLAEKGTRP